MTYLFGIPIDTLTTVLLAATLAIIGVVALLALGNAIFFRIGVRNIPRRRTQMWLIIFALMLSTTLLSSVLATGDVITSAVQTVAVYNLGSVDETIEGGHGALGFFPDGVYYQINDLARHDSDIAAVGAALVEHDLLVADSTSRQHVAAIVVDGGLVGQRPYLLSNIQFFRNIEQRNDDITQIFIANRGGANGVDLSGRVTQSLRAWIPGDVHIIQVKQQGVQNSQKA